MGLLDFFGDIFRSVEGDVKTGPDALSHALELARSNLRINYIGHYEALTDSSLAEPLPMLCADFRNPMNAPVLEPPRFDAIVEGGYRNIERHQGWAISDLLDADFPASTKDDASTSTRRLQSLFVPGNWTVTIGSHAFHGPTIRFIGLNTGGLDPDEVSIVKFSRKAIGDRHHKLASWTENRLQLAMGRSTLHVAGYPLRSWEPHTRFTDEFMHGYCLTNRDNHDECACFRDREEMEQKYPDITLPVTCYGENCGGKGYRTSEMETETCSYQICLADVQAHGKNLQNLGTTELYCAGKFFSTDPREAALQQSGNVTEQPVTTVFLPTHKTNEGTGVETWVILGIGILVFAILFYFLLATYVLKKK